MVMVSALTPPPPKNGNVGGLVDNHLKMRIFDKICDSCESYYDQKSALNILSSKSNAIPLCENRFKQFKNFKIFWTVLSVNNYVRENLCPY